jgi:hypothetical protein
MRYIRPPRIDFKARRVKSKNGINSGIEDFSLKKIVQCVFIKYRVHFKLFISTTLAIARSNF